MGGILRKLLLDEIWLQEWSSMGSQKETGRHVLASSKRHVATVLPKIASVP